MFLLDNHFQLIILKWDLSSNFEFVRKVENWIYKNIDSSLYIRITEPCHRSLPQLEAELDWMFYLYTQNIHFAHPVKSNEGNLIEVIKDGSHTFYVSVFEKANGKPLIQKDDFTISRLRAWGRLIGDLHSKTLYYKGSNLLEKRPSWDSENNFINIKQFCSENDVFFSKFTILKRYLYSLPRENFCYNLIHADIHHGNFFVNDEDCISLFDFDDCHYHWFIYDLAVPIFNLGISLRNDCTNLELESMYAEIVHGYQKTSPLKSEWLKKLDVFILYRAFVIHYWCKNKLMQDDLSDNARKWMSMAQEFSRKYIESFDTRKLK